MMDSQLHPGPRRSMWRAIGVMAALIIGGLWLAMLLAELLPAHWMRWHVEADIEVTEEGISRVYFDDGGGIAESKTVDGKVHKGRQRVHFVLPEHVLQGVRFDPIDQPGRFTVHDLRLLGPFGSEITTPDSKGKEKAVELLIKPDQAINANQVPGAGVGGSDVKEESTSTSFLAENEDPHFFLNMKPKPVVPPSRGHDIADLVVLLLGLSIALTLAFSLRHRTDFVENGVFVLAAAAVVSWVLAHYLLKVQRIDAAFAYRLVLPLLLLAPLCAWLRGSLSLRAVPVSALALVAWLSYFGVRALAVPPGATPSRLDLLVATFLLLALLAAGLACGPQRWRRFLGWGFALWLPVAVWAAVEILFKSYHPDWDLDYRAAYFASPLFRPISGSACFALGAVALVALSVKGRLSLWLRVLMILMLAILCVYFLQAKSRAVVVAAVVAVLFVVVLAREVHVAITGCMALAFCVVFAFTSWPNSIADALSGENVGAADAETAGQPYRVVGSIVRPDALRPAIYAAYLRASMRHPVFGHGFAGEHAIVIDSKEIMKVQPEFVGRAWNPHNFHLSVLYFGGIVGIVLHAAMLGLPMWFGLRAFLKNRDPFLLALLGMVAFAGIKLLFESTMMNIAKDAVVFFRPNEYWLFFWGPLILLNVHLAHLRGDGLVESGSPSESLSVSA